MRTGKVVVVGSYNQGFWIVGPALPQKGETVLGHTFGHGPGGKGSNQAIGARRLGADVTFVVKLGRDAFATEARELFAAEGLLGPGILEADTHTGVGLVLVDDAGSNMISVAPGANATLTEGDLDAVPDLFEGAAVLLCQLESPPELFAAAAVRARAAGVTTVLNPAPAQVLPSEMYPLMDIVTPNESELATLTGMPTNSPAEIEAAARALLEAGVGRVVATLGEQGALLVDGGEARSFPAQRVKAVDTTGAGDSFNAGLAAGLAAGAVIDKAIQLGGRAGAFCVTRLGVVPGLPTMAQLDAEVPA